MNDELDIGADVTINGVVIKKNTFSFRDNTWIVQLNSGRKIEIDTKDINTYRPKIEVPDKDMRKGK